ncbi:unnamed protein product [Musa hybrid cultivar]
MVWKGDGKRRERRGEADGQSLDQEVSSSTLEDYIRGKERRNSRADGWRPRRGGAPLGRGGCFGRRETGTTGAKGRSQCIPFGSRSLNCALIGCILGREERISNPWPRSRNEVWVSNVPHTCLGGNKGSQNWIIKIKVKLNFLVDRTQYIHDQSELESCL